MLHIHRKCFFFSTSGVIHDLTVAVDLFPKEDRLSFTKNQIQRLDYEKKLWIQGLGLQNGPDESV